MRLGIESGRFATADDAMRDALQRWENYERKRFELIAHLKLGETDLENGNYTEITSENAHEFFEELKREARLETPDRKREL